MTNQQNSEPALPLPIEWANRLAHQIHSVANSLRPSGYLKTSVLTK